MNDDLDSKTDSEIDELFAVEVCEWHRGDETAKRDEYRGYWYDAKGGVPHIATFAPLFCTDANAVLPWLEKDRNTSTMDIRIFPNGWGISIRTKNSPTAPWFAGRALSFARAAVIALIRAKRATK